MTYQDSNTEIRVRPSRETIGERSVTHGRSKTPEYYIWKTMKARCYNPRNKSFYRYGGRGVTVCDRWLESFENFLEDMGERPEGLTLERKLNKGNYEPSNCVWDTPKAQANNRDSNCLLTYDGRTQTIQQWSEEVPIKRATLLQRYHAGWDAHEILTTPVTDKSTHHQTDAITYQGRTQSLTEWAVQLNIKRLVLYKRLFIHGWSVEQSLTTPVRSY